jgi:hypothetical protein
MDDSVENIENIEKSEPSEEIVATVTMTQKEDEAEKDEISALKAEIEKVRLDMENLLVVSKPKKKVTSVKKTRKVKIDDVKPVKAKRRVLLERPRVLMERPRNIMYEQEEEQEYFPRITYPTTHYQTPLLYSRKHPFLR